jgi:hypothetical protein
MLGSTPLYMFGESSNEDSHFFLISKSSKYKTQKGHFIDAYKGTVRRSVRGGSKHIQRCAS